MTDIYLIENDAIEAKVEIIMRQTNYTKIVAKEKLHEYNFNEISVIKEYFGIIDKKETKKVSLNQEIYKQLRYKMNATMSEKNKFENNEK